VQPRGTLYTDNEVVVEGTATVDLKGEWRDRQENETARTQPRKTWSRSHANIRTVEINAGYWNVADTETMLHWEDQKGVA
jgi:hypothetical protein